MKVFLLGLLLTFEFATPAKILGFFPLPFYSHQPVFENLMLALNRRGHDITIITPNPSGVKRENYTEVDTSFVHRSRTIDDYIQEPTSKEMLLWILLDNFYNFVELHFDHEPVRQIFRNGSFDLVFVEYLMMPSATALSYHFNVPYIGITSIEIVPTSHLAIGNPFNPAYCTDWMLPHGDTKTFPERLRSTMYFIYRFLIYFIFVIPRHDALAKKHFGPDTPHVYEIEKNVSLIFDYRDRQTWYPTPSVPGYIEIAGGRPLHMTEFKPLPKDIQEYMDQAKDGVVYFSLGSNVKSNAMPESKRRIFMEAFRRIKQKVLWKWEADELPGKPDNVKIGKWFPQTDILAHPNVRLFITQGGLQSVSEATYNKIPMIVIPFFADQEMNAKKLVSEGVAIRVDYEYLELESFVSTLNELLNNKKYKERIIEYSALTQDQPEDPLDRAIWWTEYVIRHKGARHLRSAAVDMPWYQYLLLDVIAFLIVVLLLVLYIFYIISKFVIRILFKRNKPKKD